MLDRAIQMQLAQYLEKNIAIPAKNSGSNKKIDGKANKKLVNMKQDSNTGSFSVDDEEEIEKQKQKLREERE